MPEGVGYPPARATQQAEPSMSAFDRLMLALTGREPRGQPKGGADDLMLRQRGMQPPQETEEEAFRRLQREKQQGDRQGRADPNMIQRALGSLFGGQ